MNGLGGTSETTVPCVWDLDNHAAMPILCLVGTSQPSAFSGRQVTEARRMGGEGKAARRAPSERILRCVSEGAGASTQPSAYRRRAAKRTGPRGRTEGTFAEEDVGVVVLGRLRLTMRDAGLRRSRRAGTVAYP
jgi:hypothetical protein